MIRSAAQFLCQLLNPVLVQVFPSHSVRARSVEALVGTDGIEGFHEPLRLADESIQFAKALVWMACSQFGKMCLFLLDVVQGSSSLVFRYSNTVNTTALPHVHGSPVLRVLRRFRPRCFFSVLTTYPSLLRERNASGSPVAPNHFTH